MANLNITASPICEPTQFFGKIHFSAGEIKDLSKFSTFRVLLDKKALAIAGVMNAKIDYNKDNLLTLSVERFLVKEGEGKPLDKTYHGAHHLIGSSKIISELILEDEYFELAKNISRYCNEVHIKHLLSGKEGGNMFINEFPISVINNRSKQMGKEIIYIFSHMSRVDATGLTKEN